MRLSGAQATLLLEEIRGDAARRNARGWFGCSLSDIKARIVQQAVMAVATYARRKLDVEAFLEFLPLQSDPKILRVMKLHPIALVIAVLLGTNWFTFGAATVALTFSTVGYEIYDRDGVILSGGIPTISHDGTVVQIGYYTSDPILNTDWIPITGEGSLNLQHANTTVGDGARRDGRFGAMWFSRSATRRLA